MLKMKVIFTVLKALLWIVLLGVGVWYLSSSIGGGSISYASLDSFLRATGACKDGVCDIAATNGCFLCPYIERLFYTIGQAAESFWNVLIDHIWILLSLGFIIFLFVHTAKFLQEQNKLTEKMNTAERKLPFDTWFNKVWKQAVRVMVVGALIGAIGYGGTQSIKLVADITITPVMFIGSELSMAATGVSDSAQCGNREDIINTTSDPRFPTPDNDIMGPAMRPFMCVIGNLNTVILAGAAGGFALMNYAWMGLGGGMFTWIAGLALVLMFLVIGFNIFFKILTVVFQLVFLIIFLPLIIAAAAYENVWGLLKGVFTNAIDILIRCAVRVVAITLQILIVYAMVLFAADEYFPGPRDGYSAILPPGIALSQSTVFTKYSIEPNSQTASVMDVFSKCETQAALPDGGVDKDTFKACFMIQRAEVESRHPGAFDFMSDGLEFILMMIGLFLVYFYVIQEKIDKVLGGTTMIGDKEGSFGDKFEYGKYVREFGESMWRGPQQLLDKLEKTFSKEASEKK